MFEEEEKKKKKKKEEEDKEKVENDVQIEIRNYGRSGTTTAPDDYLSRSCSVHSITVFSFKVFRRKESIKISIILYYTIIFLFKIFKNLSNS